MQTKTVTWIELTSPWEENLAKKHFQKTDKYNKLAIGLREGKHHGVKWTVVPLCVEVRTRGATDAGTGCANVSTSANVQSVG